MASTLQPASAPPRRSSGPIRIVWVTALLALALWSLAAWATALLFSGSGDFLAAQAALWADHYPELERVAASGSAWLAHFGTAALWIVWAFGATLIVFFAWLIARGVQMVRAAFDGARPQAAAALGRWQGRTDEGHRTPPDTAIGGPPPTARG